MSDSTIEQMQMELAETKLAKAWQEGYSAGLERASRRFEMPSGVKLTSTDNPYMVAGDASTD